MGNTNEKKDNEDGILWFSDFDKMKEWLKKNSKEKHDYKVFSLFGLKNLDLSALKQVLEEHKSFFQEFKMIDLSETRTTENDKEPQDLMASYLDVTDTISGVQFIMMDSVDHFWSYERTRFINNGNERHDKEAAELRKRLAKVVIHHKTEIELVEIVEDEMWQKRRDRAKEIFPNMIELHKSFFSSDLGQQLVRFHKDRKKQAKFEMERKILNKIEKQVDQMLKTSEEEEPLPEREATEEDIAFLRSFIVNELKRDQQSNAYEERRKKRKKMGLE